jgi:hypothetical protein
MLEPDFVVNDFSLCLPGGGGSFTMIPPQERLRKENQPYGTERRKVQKPAVAW